MARQLLWTGTGQCQIIILYNRGWNYIQHCTCTSTAHFGDNEFPLFWGCPTILGETWIYKTLPDIEQILYCIKMAVTDMDCTVVQYLDYFYCMITILCNS